MPGRNEGTDRFCPVCSGPLGLGDSGPDSLVDALQASESRFRAAFADAGIGMALIGSDDRIIEANPAFAAMIGREAPNLVRTHIHEIIDPEDTPRRLYLELLRGERDRLRVEKKLKHREGHAVWSNVTISLIRDGAGHPMYTLAMVEDVTEQRLLGDQLAYQAMHDPLTRLPNRTLFFERLNALFGPGQLAEATEAPDAADAADAPVPDPVDPVGPGELDSSARPDGPDRLPQLTELAGQGKRVGLCYVDLDGFAAINETLGHHVGDELLVAVAARLEHGFARGDGRLVARLGGDEFAVLVCDSDGSEQLTSLAAELIKMLEEPFDVAGQQLVVTASVGVVERRIVETTPTDLLKDADATLYWSKADGRARWTLYDPDRGAHQLTRQRLATALRPALERGEFTVEYQPLVGLADGTVHGAEALVRWRHPRYGTLSPDRFIPLAEESGAIVPLGKWVLEESCRQAKRWLLEFPDAETFVSVNLAARQIWDSDVVADVAQALKLTGLPARLLQLEITESAVLGPGGRPVQALQALADMGIRIAIDDFGTGYSNLAYLSRLPVHVLKLDGSFIEGFRDPAPGGRPDSRFRRTDADEQIVGAMVQLAHALGLTVTAEGIENASQAERLRLTGCDTAQGWYFARPGEAERIAAILREGRVRSA
ncbi:MULTISPECIES: bifunctional diguanylate cyclase/phosphodiesterase [unclassified Kitasatospora]|uniref:putative bifunctional diguanylate cyclase/phosphodiesterase n=1 Tax=unclassified Kitasatospora TaxID=2633591 RepID=UPI00070EA6C1|nr:MULTISPECIES: bifunctional diguanylate cyclase/phosphodiesterase [unclassified Kitasatospora]KQV11752.1 histidine kinase [Kitasatospora sp. Root107]KRB76666.1 histidine kinase [Kitasatospora sp. Root187]